MEAPLHPETVVSRHFDSELISCTLISYSYGSLILSTAFNIWQVCEITEFLKVDGPSALGLFGALDSSVCCGVAVRLYEDSKNQRVIGQCLELVQK
jgi:hypothetical protein